MQADHAAAPAVARVLLGAVAREASTDAAALASLFGTAEDAEAAVASALAHVLGLGAREHLYEI